MVVGTPLLILQLYCTGLAWAGKLTERVAMVSVVTIGAINRGFILKLPIFNSLRFRLSVRGLQSLLSKCTELFGIDYCATIITSVFCKVTKSIKLYRTFTNDDCDILQTPTASSMALASKFHNLAFLVLPLRDFAFDLD